MKVPFVGPSYTVRSLNADAQKSLNCYLEVDQTSDRAPVALYGRPGSTVAFTLPTSPTRGCIAQGSNSFWVAGDSVYVVNSSLVATLLGTIGTSTGRVSMASNGTEVIIVDGVNGWLATTTTLTQITDGDFPNGVRVVTQQDGYFIVTGNDSDAFYLNETPRVGDAWSGTEFASAEGSPDYTIGCISDHRELWLFGETSIEIWVNTGNPDFPFERSNTTFIEQGCAAAQTIAAMNNTLYWMGRSKQGDGMVFKAQGYTPVRISTHAIEKAILSYGDISDAFSFCFQMEGHSFYVLTFPTSNATWVYDASTEQWAEWSWRDPNLNTDNRWRPNCYCFQASKHLAGDYESGDVYELSLDVNTDDGVPIRFLRRSQTMQRDQKRLFFSVLQVDMETASTTDPAANPTMMLRWSDDGGHSWSDYRSVSIGKVGQYGARARFTRLGQGRNRVWEISITDDVPRAILGAFAEVKAGAN